KGDYIRFDAFPRINDRLLRIIVKEKTIIKRIKIKGNKSLRSVHIRGALQLSKGDYIRFDAFPRINDRLLHYLNKKGFPDALVDVSLLDTRKPNFKTLKLAVNEGTPLYVREIQVLGKELLPEHDATRFMKLKRNSIFDQFVLEEDMERIATYFKEQGYFQTVVGPYDYADGLLTLGVHPGKKLTIEIFGNRSISKKIIRRLMPFTEAGELTDDLVSEAVSRVRTLYQERSFSAPKVAPIIIENEREITIKFYIHEGKPSVVRKVDINTSTIPPEKIMELMVTKSGKNFRPKLLELDIQRIKDFVVALGYQDAKIEAPIIKEESDGVDITFDIEEGEQYFIDVINVIGPLHVPVEELREAIRIKKGDPYNEVDLIDARRRALDVCKRYGYADCKIVVRKNLNPEGMYMAFLFDEGERFFFGKTIIRGNAKTHPKVIIRQFSYKDGEPYRAEALSETKHKLRKLAIFDNINFTPLGRETERDIVLDINEGFPGAVEFGIGYGEYEQYRGFLDISYRNLFGLQKTAIFRTELSTLWQRYIITYQEPYLFDWPVESRTFLLKENRKEKNIDTGEISYRVDKVSASTGLEKKIGKKVTTNIYFTYSIVETYDVQPDVVLSKEDTGTLAISSISPGLIYDSRDNPFDPKYGLLGGITLKIASKAFGSETNFVKVTGQVSAYHALYRWLVPAVSFKAGIARGQGDVVQLPLIERFFLGGRNTVRGFDQDSLGPIGPLGTPIGGNAFLLANIEFRFALSSGWRVVPFVDGGQVWGNEKDMSVSDFRYTAGLGIQYNTPVGPLRLDYGVKIDKEPDETVGELHFSLGHAF
ncbi:outer membrane protein assembly factor BamA, partial [Nitrospirota bacterium]